MDGPDIDPAELCELALDAATRAAELITAGRPSALRIDQKSTHTDSVTQMDLAAEALIRSVIDAERPGDQFLGEESATKPLRPRAGEVTWIVDPIDGTTNYIYDLPGYNISIAAAIGDQVVAAVVADPSHNRVYRAQLGAGAFCNDMRLELPASRPDLTLDTALIATGFGYSAEMRARQGTVVAALLPRIRDIRRFGAAALDLCHVASGRVDGYFEVNLGPWDLAAGALIATEAGAVVAALTDHLPLPQSVIAAHPTVFDELKAALVGLDAAGVIAPEDVVHAPWPPIGDN